jgi:hypothetical protein
MASKLLREDGQLNQKRFGWTTWFVRLKLEVGNVLGAHGQQDSEVGDAERALEYALELCLMIVARRTGPSMVVHPKKPLPFVDKENRVAPQIPLIR